MRGRIGETSKDGNSSESVNDIDSEETTEEEEDGEDTDDSQENTPQLTHTATELTDAVSYMSKAELDKLRGVSESVEKNPTTAKSKKAEIKAEIEIEEEEEEDETGFTCPYEHVTYLSAADLKLLRDTDPDLKMVKNGKDKKLKERVRESEDDDDEDDDDDVEGADDGDRVRGPASMSSTPYLTLERGGQGERGEREAEGQGGERGEREGGGGEGGEGHESLKRKSVSRSKRAGKLSRRDSLKHINWNILSRRSSAATEAAHAHEHTHTHVHEHAHNGEEGSGGLRCSAHHAGDVRSHEGEEDDENDEEEDEEEKELHMKREKDLDFQYEESDDKLWANIPPGQKLPFPSLHLFLDSVSSFFLSSLSSLSFPFFFPSHLFLHCSSSSSPSMFSTLLAHLFYPPTLLHSSTAIYFSHFLIIFSTLSLLFFSILLSDYLFFFLYDITQLF